MMTPSGVWDPTVFSFSEIVNLQSIYKHLVQPLIHPLYLKIFVENLFEGRIEDPPFHKISQENNLNIIKE